ncbi:hypothetical protein [Aquisphaera insulae]|uniref:hypothetical protein n=1 Tax=Aquisphaera insulae TaxID=2712864 RepID=UPI0013EBAF53|nr:hypothetical protein [Aquisphaera insulae]
MRRTSYSPRTAASSILASRADLDDGVVTLADYDAARKRIGKHLCGGLRDHDGTASL